MRNVFVLTAVLLGAPALASAAVVMPAAFYDQVRVSGLDRPTSITFLPDGRMLVTEQYTGNVRLIVAGSLLSPVPVHTQPDLLTNYEQGLLSLAVDPGWPARPYIYVDYNSNAGCIRLVRYTGFGDIADPGGTALTFGDPYVVLDALPDSLPMHNGGTARFGPDGKLYLSLGDDAHACLAQDSTSLHGCILRLDVSGLPAGPGGPPPRRSLAAADNHWIDNPDSNASLLFSFGYRNPFRFQFDRQTGQMYVSDVGENTWEELDAPVAGSNAGWPHREALALVDYPYCPEPGGQGTNLVLDPVDWYDHTQGSVIISAGVFRPSTMSTAWPQSFDGNVFYADWQTGILRMIRHEEGVGWIRLQGNGTPNGSDWATGLPSPVDFAWGPDGNLWWVSYQDSTFETATGSIHRISYVPGVLGASEAEARLDLFAIPNPWRGHADLTFRLPSPSRVQLDVFDVVGRRIATLIDGDRPAGFQQARWDGRNQRGEAVPEGLYFARLRWDGGVVTQRLVRMR